MADKTEQITIRVTPKMKKFLLEEANRRDMSMSQFVLDCALSRTNWQYPSDFIFDEDKDDSLCKPRMESMGNWMYKVGEEIAYFRSETPMPKDMSFKLREVARICRDIGHDCYELQEETNKYARVVKEVENFID